MVCARSGEYVLCYVTRRYNFYWIVASVWDCHGGLRCKENIVGISNDVTDWISNIKDRTGSDETGYHTISGEYVAETANSDCVACILLLNSNARATGNALLLLHCFNSHLGITLSSSW